MAGDADEGTQTLVAFALAILADTRMRASTLLGGGASHTVEIGLPVWRFVEHTTAHTQPLVSPKGHIPVPDALGAKVVDGVLKTAAFALHRGAISHMALVVHWYHVLYHEDHVLLAPQHTCASHQVFVRIPVAPDHTLTPGAEHDLAPVLWRPVAVCHPYLVAEARSLHAHDPQLRPIVPSYRRRKRSAMALPKMSVYCWMGAAPKFGSPH
jgi:hypothetical protein